MAPQDTDSTKEEVKVVKEEQEQMDVKDEKDEEKERKKKEKAREKELKKLKAAQKAEAAKAPAPPSKKSEQKAKKAAAAADDADAVDPPTTPGEKKRLAPEMAKTYNPKAVEASWYEWWEKSGYFIADPHSKKPPFVIVVPPPNVTGALHIGHGLTGAVEDLIIRWRRMSGYNTLWVPGVDHAGIATQVVVEKTLMKERKQTRHDLGREKFVAEVHKWKDQYGGQICRQYRRLGASLDWSRECFTLDEKRSQAVTEAFVRLHKEKLIYRDNRLGNWDCVLRTAISDIEVDYEDIKGRTLRRVPGYDNPVEFGAITSFAYPLEEGGEIVVATTRPETMLGDTAVAVHPEDPRYKHLHGKFVIHPFQNRKIPIVCDAELVDMAFGTGAVKITPAHDPNDFAVGKRHNLEFINIFTDDGLINSNGGKPYAGMKRFDARVAVVKDLESKGLFRGVADNAMRLGICSRSNDVIEPMIKPQWFVDCKDMAKEACDVVRDGRLEIIPNQFEDTWFRWLENIRDWCISRQLWWGHRVPAWYATVEDDARTEMGAYPDHWVVARDVAEAESIAKAKFSGKKFTLEQDPDVLDTWFSSGLFPFSVMGWPEESEDMKAFYPTSVLETGHDILFFWVARMVMMGLKLTGVSPFKQVFLHAMVRDAHGRKMSKSLGNVIDPLEVINGVSLDDLHKRLEQGNLDAREVEKAKAGQKADFPNGIAECGADALRFALVAYTAQSVNINLDIQRVVGYRQWCNKLWNVIRFAMTNLGSDFVPSATITPSSLPLSCQWILSVLNKAIDKTVKALESYQFSDATTSLHSWWLYELCDVFIEVIKPTMFGNDEAAKRATRDTLWLCLDTGLRMLHPFMPYLTEELWQRLPNQGSQPKTTIVLAEYPAVNQEWANEEAEAEMDMVNAVAKATRTLRMAYELQPKLRPDLYVMCRAEKTAEIVTKGASEIATLSLSSSVKVLREMEEAPLGCAVAVVDENTTVYLLLRNVVDPSVEISRLQKKRDDLIRQQEALVKKTSIAGYAEKVPKAVLEENESKASKLAAELQTVTEATANFEKLLIST